MRTSIACIALTALAAGLAITRPDALADSKSEKVPADVSADLAPIREARGVPALGGAILTIDGLAAIGVDGLRVAGGKKPVTTEDRWHLGSCTKTMTATLMGLLEDARSLPMAQRLSVALPKAAKRMDAGWRDVTLLQLLQHRGGAPADVPPDLWACIRLEPLEPRAARALLTKSTLEAPPPHEPGSGYVYSNTGYAVAGHVAEVHTDNDWEDLLRRDVFEPLGMKDSGFGAPGSAKKRDQPWGHVPGDDGARPVPPGPMADNPPGIGPAATVHATLEDWAKFVRLHLLGARKVPDLLLSPRAFHQLHTPPAGQSYAAGWMVTTQPWAKGPGREDTGRVLTHSGSNTMWYATVWVAPERGFAVLATCNQGGADAAAACNDVILALVTHHLEADRR